MSSNTAVALVSLPATRSGAAELSPAQRTELAIHTLARSQPITELAAQSDVSRKFVYRQAHKAQDALSKAFEPPANDDADVLFCLPVTASTIVQSVLALLLNCRCSYRGVIDFLRDVFDYPISLGTIHNIVSGTVDKARSINRQQDLSPIRVGAHDEIFQGDPVLVGVDPHSTYCYLLNQEPNRDATTWGVHLLDLSEQGLRLTNTIADAGKGLRAGQAEAWPGVTCWGDVFHAEREVGKMTAYLDNRAFGTIGTRDKLERKMQQAKSRGKGQSVSKQLALARRNELLAIQLADDMRLLASWLHDDILCFHGPDAQVRRELYDFVVSEIRAREHLAPHRISPVRTALENQRDDLLAFAEAIDKRIREITHERHLPLKLVREAFEMQRHSPSSCRYWQLDVSLQARIGSNWEQLKQQLASLKDEIVRASSMVENINSRLRNYFFLRRELGPDYLELLKFFLNHRRYPRSRKDARVGRSPAEILAATTLPHWLEQLGFTLFRQPA